MIGRLFLLWLLFGTVWGQIPAVVEAPRADLLPLETPDLQPLETAVAQQLAQAQTDLQQAIPRGDTGKIAAAYGFLGEIYHAYEFFPQAEICYRNTLALVPQHPEALYMCALLLQKTSRFPESERLFTSYLALKPQDAAAFFHLGELAWVQNRLEEAAAFFGKSLEIQETAATHGQLGQIALARKDYQTGLSHFFKALELLPEATRINYFIATIYRRLKDMDKAAQYLQKAGKIGPSFGDPHLARLEAHAQSERRFMTQGRAAFDAGDWAAALSLFGQALQINPASIPAKTNLATVLAGQGREQEAITLFQEVLAVEPDHGTSHYNLGFLFSRAKDTQKARFHLEKALQDNPRDASALRLLADLLAETGAIRPALAHYQRLLELNPTLEDAMLQRARLLIGLQAYEEAAAALEHDWRKNMDLGRLTHFYARFLATCPRAEFRDGPKAIQLAAAVVKAQPAPGHLETLALAHAQAGDCQAAARWQTEAISAARQADPAGETPARFEQNLRRYQQGPPCAFPSK